MSEAQPPAAPHEPEIEFLGKLAHGFFSHREAVQALRMAVQHRCAVVWRRHLEVVELVEQLLEQGQEQAAIAHQTRLCAGLVDAGNLGPARRGWPAVVLVDTVIRLASLSGNLK